MDKKKFRALSPDGFDISHNAVFDSDAKAKKALSHWVKRYRQQGYYSTSDLRHIPYNKILSHCKIIPNS